MPKASTRSKNRTPKRKSIRKRTRTAKGLYYDENFNDFTGEMTPVAVEPIAVKSVGPSKELSPPIGDNLDSTQDIVDRIAASASSESIDPSEESGPSI